MLDEYLRSLALEYLAICADMQSGAHDAAERRELSSQRTWIHDELVRVLGPEYDRPYDMKSHCRQLVAAV